MSDPNAIELAEIKGQLKVMTQLLVSHHAATHQRIDDMHKSVEARFDGVETRFDGVEKRLSTLEQNERGTAIRTAGISAVSAALVSAGIAILKSHS
jgi:DNA-binding FrmR family transcriptional regulator